MSKVSCDIIKDLLPLYYDKVCSNDSRKLVEEHLSECSSCKSELNKIEEGIDLPKETIKQNLKDGNEIKNIAIFFKRSKVKAFLIGLVCSIALFTFVFLAFTYPIAPVPTSVMRVTEVSKLADGKIAYHVKIEDGYKLNRLEFDMDKDGNFYITPKRPFIKTKEVSTIPGFKDMYYTFGDFLKTVYHDKYGSNAEIKALYFGTPKDKILIWKKGMDLPKASKEIEEYLSNQSNNFMPY